MTDLLAVGFARIVFCLKSREKVLIFCRKEKIFFSNRLKSFYIISINIRNTWSAWRVSPPSCRPIRGPKSGCVALNPVPLHLMAGIESADESSLLGGSRSDCRLDCRQDCCRGCRPCRESWRHRKWTHIQPMERQIYWIEIGFKLNLILIWITIWFSFRSFFGFLFSQFEDF